MCSDPHRGCMITSSIEIALASLGFIMSASAIKYQDAFNDLVLANVGVEQKIDVTIASVMSGFFFLALITAAAGVHGYRSRNRWFYLGHLVFALFLALSYFGIFIDAIVQFKRMHAHVEDNAATTQATPTTVANVTAEAQVAPAVAEKTDVKEVVDRLGFPTAICFIHIVLYLLSGRYAWKAWQDSTSPTIQREILDEEPEEKQNQEPI